MKKKIISLCVATLLATAQTLAGMTLTVPDVTIAPGGTASVIINFDLGTPAYTAYQFEIAYPDGINSESDSEGNPAFTKGDVYHERHSVSSAYTSQGLSLFQCFSIYSDPFTSQSGTLLMLSIKAQKSLAEGTYQATIAPIEFVQTDATPDRPDAVTFNIVVSRNVRLDETSTASPGAAANVNVHVKRTINADEWSTICLPFAMTAEQCKAAFGDDVQIADFNDYEYDDAADAISVKFVDATAIEANHPYVIKVGKAVTEFTAEGVDIDPQEAVVDFDTDKRNRYPRQFVGTYVAGTVLEWGTLFLSGNQFWYSVGNTQMKAFRAYFNFTDVLASFDDSYGARISLHFGDGEATDIGAALNDEGKMINDNVYDLQGRRVEKPAKGIYVSHGKKQVVR